MRYRWVELNDGNIWMADNLAYVTESSLFYENDPSFRNATGCLYRWEDLENACPEGWRVPTLKDWIKMIESYGGYFDNISNRYIGDPKVSFSKLCRNKEIGFNVNLGGMMTNFGYKNDDVSGLGKYGYYWSSTGSVKNTAWYTRFNLSDRVIGKFND